MSCCCSDILKIKSGMDLVHLLHKLVRCVSRLLLGMEESYSHHYLILLKSSLYNAYMTLQLSVLPTRLFHYAQPLSFELKRNTIRILC